MCIRDSYTGSISDESSNGLSMTASGNTTASYSSPYIESKSPLTAITNTQLLTCQNSTGAITDASSNGYTITANGNVTAHSSSDFSGSGGTPSTTASFNLLGYDSANSPERFTTGTVYNFGGGGLLTKVATRDSQTSFAFNIGDSDNSTAGGSIKLLGGHDSANSVDKFASGTIYNFGGGGLLTKVATRDSQNNFAFNIGDSSKGTSGLPIRLLADDSANSLERFSSGTIYTFEKTALNTILSTRSPRTGFGGNLGSLADSGGAVGGGGGGGGGGGASSYEFVIIT